MQVDPRGQRFSAILTSIVLIVVLVTSSWLLLAAQAVVFAIGVAFGLRSAPYGLIYQALVRPRLGPPKELEPETPPRAGGGCGVRAGRSGGVRPRDPSVGYDRHSVRADRGVPQRRLRAVPGL
jgi:hypothetical protein